ncbi:hypothetical protein [Glycomyces salinus]|uniref:hypothetical protein n=1 Tax=Glycomyces salinus TaxID=980294 RepID=UPI0018EC2B6B|nr:hypothetical protein [Glycomyces salinus]
MKELRCSIDMSQVAGCQAEEILVQRTGDNFFWCEATKGNQRMGLGPAVLDFDGRLTERWHPTYRALIGGEENLKAFFDALEGFLRQWKVIA